MNNKRGPYSSPLQKERQKRILDAARAELKDKGVSNLTMRGVADVADVSLKTVYNLFGNRDMLLLRVSTERFNSIPNQDIIRESDPGIRMLLAYTEAAMNLFAASPEFSAISVGILFRLDKEIASGDDLIAQFRQLTYASLADAIQHAELKPQTDIDSLASLLCAHQWGLVLMWEKELISLDQLKLKLPLSHCLSLLHWVEADTAQWMQPAINDYQTRLEQLQSNKPIQVLA